MRSPCGYDSPKSLARGKGLAEEDSRRSEEGEMTKRERASPLGSGLVRCVCVSASLVATGCALLGLGLSCVLLPHLDPSSAGCPRPMAVGAFAASGALLAGALGAAALTCRRKPLGGLPPEVPPEAPHYKKKLSLSEGAGPPNAEPLTKDEGDAFEMTQISAEVSQWIEQQEDSALPAPSESFCLEIAGGSPSRPTEQENSDGEMTAL